MNGPIKRACQFRDFTGGQLQQSQHILIGLKLGPNLPQIGQMLAIRREGGRAVCAFVGSGQVLQIAAFDRNLPKIVICAPGVVFERFGRNTTVLESGLKV